MRYEARIVPSAQRDMDRLPTPIGARISSRILTPEDNPRPRGANKLSGREEYRLRVGDYRVLYTIDEEGHIVTVLAVGHRREVYR